MSHEVQYKKATMPALHLIQAAAPRIGLEVVLDRKVRKSYGGRQVKCDHVIRVIDDPQAYEAGLVATDEGYVPEFDDYGEQGRRLASRIGPGAGKLVSAYAEACVEEAARQQGSYIESRQEVQINGEDAVVLDLVYA